MGVQLNLVSVCTELVEHLGIKLVRKVTVFVTYHYETGGTRQRSWLRHYATSRNVAGSSPDEVDFFK
jgi:hypothetical protein